MKESYFHAIADGVCRTVAGTDRVTLFYSAEATDFIRFNQARVRQATHVEQHIATVSVVLGLKQATSELTLTGDAAADIATLRAERDQLVRDLSLVPDDRHLMLPDEVVSTRHEAGGTLPSPEHVIQSVARAAASSDFVGIYTGGPVVRGYADSRGQRNWHRVESFHFEWCLYRQADQAVKTTYAGTAWDDAVFAAKMATAREQEKLLALPRRTLQPGAYRVYFSPGAVADMLGMLAWGGFGLRGVKTGVGSLVTMHDGSAAMAPGITISEDATGGIAPRFQETGFVKPDAVALVRSGRVAEVLVSPRSAREYGAVQNGANSAEYPEQLVMAPGELDEADVLPTLGTGVWISDLHYLNYSDKQACRLTGMTRFACFWVEGGRLAAPIGVMRFDDSFLRMFGEGLVGLTRRAELVPDSRTYYWRFLASVTAPGAVVDDFRLTL
ncbi:MAG: TldE/PmbA family protein [Burkholderiales bacterium]|nr:TldE/PmbA family protein [Burkholderiales bacterium]